MGDLDVILKKEVELLVLNRASSIVASSAITRRETELERETKTRLIKHITFLEIIKQYIDKNL